jgi:hypothetical protein
VPNQYQRGGASDAGRTPSISLALGLALAPWNPFLGPNATYLEGFSALAREWEDFVGRRLKEDVALVQRLTRSSTPDQVLSAYADFWRKAGEDYGKKVATITELTTDMTSKVSAATHTAIDDRGTSVRREAA